MLSIARPSSTFALRRAPLSKYGRAHPIKSLHAPLQRTQTRHFFYMMRLLWHAFGPRKKLNTPFQPSSSEVRFTEDNIWARAGHEPGTLVIGITEQAKDLLRPGAGLEIGVELDQFVPTGTQIGTVRFYHPDDMEHGRAEKEILEWAIRMPTPGVLTALSSNRQNFLDPDPYYGRWLLCFSEVTEWDWNTLLTTQEYLDYVERTPNLLGISWRRSLYASPNRQHILFKESTPNKTKVLREVVEKQTEKDRKVDQHGLRPPDRRPSQSR